ncbi:MAG: hypothetical protein ABSG33_06595 [Candidatus Bathyarchaeia archaeon]|jgi:hypothetical protein
MQKHYLNADKLKHKALNAARGIDVANRQILRIKFLNSTIEKRKGRGTDEAERRKKPNGYGE